MASRRKQVMAMVGLKNRISGQLSSLLQTGFFHIFGAGSLNKTLSVVLSFVLVRIISKEDYGAYAYACSIVSIFTVLNGLGVIPAVLQICSELCVNKRESDAVFKYGYKNGIIADAGFAIILLTIGLFAPSVVKGSGELLLVYCVYPLTVFLYGIKTVHLRISLMNKDYALATNIQTVLLVFFSLIGSFFFQTVGLAIGQMLAYLLAYFYLCARYPFRDKSKKVLSGSRRKDFWGVAGLSAFNELLSHALSLAGTLFVGWVLANSELVATYQIATLIPFGLLFVPSALVTYMYPYFARNNNKRVWTLRNYVKVTLGSIVLMGFMALSVIVLADPIVLLLFGDAYQDAVPLLRILMVGFFVQSAFRAPAGNLMVTQRKLLTNSIIGILTLAVSIIANIVLISHYSVIGAAVAYDITMLFSAVLYVAFYLRAVLALQEL